MSADPNEKLLEEILAHCREIARLDGEYTGSARRESVDELTVTARAVARVLERRREQETVMAASLPPTVLAPEDRLPPPPPLPMLDGGRPDRPPLLSSQPEAPPPQPVPMETAPPPPRPAGVYQPVPQYIQSRVQDFGGGEMQSAPPADKKWTPGVKKKDPLNLEQLLGTAWLLRIGGVLLLIGAAYGAMLVQDHLAPIHRLLLGYGVAAVLVVVGWLAGRRNLVAGRTAQVIGLSLAYFMSFASHYIPYARVFDGATVPVVLMIVLAGTIVVLSERWRLELLAGYGFLLGILAALISAPVSQNFALVALGVMALAAGVLLVRNEWVRLTALSLVGIYISTAVLWTVLGVDAMGSVVVPHLAALLMYHLIFSVAFWRWSRRWVARERAAEEAPPHDATPTLDVGLLPYSTAFEIINSLALIALSLHLVRWTGVFWADVHWLLFGLTAVELARLAIPASRRGELASFHVVIAFGLLTGGVIAAFDGMTESTVLAFQAMALAIAGTRAKALRWLRPLGAIPAGLAVNEFASSLSSTADLVSALAPPAMLLASALPWEYIFVRHPKRFGTGALLVLERISGAGRGLLAAAMAFAAIMVHTHPPDVGMALAAWVSVGLFAGVVVLSAELWLPAALALLLVPAVYTAVSGRPADLLGVTMPLAWLAIVYLFDEIARKYRTGVHRAIQWLAFIPLGLLLAASVYNATDLAGDWRWALLAAGSALCYGIFLSVPKIGRFPYLVRQPEEDEGDANTPELLVRYGRLSASGAVLLLLAAAGCVLVHDAPHVLWPSMALAGICAAVWLVVHRPGTKGAMVRELVFGGLAASVYTLGLLIYTGLAMEGILLAMTGGVAFYAASTFRRKPASMVLGICQMTALAVLAIVMTLGTGLPTEAAVTMGLSLAGILLVSTRIAVGARQHFAPSAVPEIAVTALRLAADGWPPLAAAMALIVLSQGVLLSGTFITVAWAAVAIGLLTAGFVFLDRSMRYTAIGVFAVSIIRVVFVDLAQSNQLTKVVAFCGLGIVMIASGIGYAMVSRRLEKHESSEEGEP